MPWPFPTRVQRRLDSLDGVYHSRSWHARNEETPHERHLRRYQEHREAAEHMRLVETALAQSRDEQFRREEAASRGATMSDGLHLGTSGARLPAYEGPSRDFRLDHMYRPATEHVQGGIQSHYQQNSSQQTISAEDRKEENLYRPTDDREAASHQRNPYQQSLFQSNNPYYQQSPRTTQSNTTRAPAFREGWDQPPTSDHSGLPPYSTSEREQRERAWWR